ncbi:hypothetical protein C2H92_11025 [Bacillus halotolerans]|nr:hypothetical protein C2H92_11025 [Bacillus halotolerans]
MCGQHVVLITNLYRLFSWNFDENSELKGAVITQAKTDRIPFKTACFELLEGAGRDFISHDIGEKPFRFLICA